MLYFFLWSLKNAFFSIHPHWSVTVCYAHVLPLSVATKALRFFSLQLFKILISGKQTNTKKKPQNQTLNQTQQTNKTKLPAWKQRTPGFDVRSFFSSKLFVILQKTNLLPNRRLSTSFGLIWFSACFIHNWLALCSLYFLPKHLILHLPCLILLWDWFQLFVGTQTHIKHSWLNRFWCSDI